MPQLLGHPAVWAFTQAKLLAWMLVLTRITGLMATLPGVGQERVPVVLRAAVGLLLASVVAPVVPPPAKAPETLLDLVGAMTVELAAGLLLGLLVAWILEAASFAGHLMDVQMGYSFAQTLDPVSAAPVSLSGSLLTQMVLLFIVVSGLHQQMILALVESFRILPMGEALPLHPKELVAAVGLLLVRGLQLAFPILLTLFLVDALEGVSARYMPQLQLIQLAFPLKIMVGLFVFAIVLRDFGGWVGPLLEEAPKAALRLLR